MGLDISVVKNIVEMNNEPDWDNEEESCDCWQVVDVFNYNTVKSDFIQANDYEFGFRAGSYSGYNRWRAQLADYIYGAHPQEIWDECEKIPVSEFKPFYKIICFSDCEGMLDYNVSKELFNDFKNNFEHILGVAKNNDGWGSKIKDSDISEDCFQKLIEWFPELNLELEVPHFVCVYICFMMGFYIASEHKGAVLFH